MYKDGCIHPDDLAMSQPISKVTLAEQAASLLTGTRLASTSWSTPGLWSL